MNTLFAVLIAACLCALALLLSRRKRAKPLITGMTARRALETPSNPDRPARGDVKYQFICAVVGESFKNPDGQSRQTIINKHVRPGMPAELIAEPDHPHDCEARAVYVAGHQIGYLKSEVAARLNDNLLFDEFSAVATVHEVHGGEGRKTYLGVTLELTVYCAEYQQADQSHLPQTRYDLIHTHKDDLETMINCCMQEEIEFVSTPDGKRRLPPAIFFQRVAILQRKQKNYQAEIDACERWLNIVAAYSSQAFVQAGDGYPIESIKPHLDISARIDKARALQAKHGVKQ